MDISTLQIIYGIIGALIILTFAIIYTDLKDK